MPYIWYPAIRSADESRRRLPLKAQVLTDEFYTAVIYMSET